MKRKIETIFVKAGIAVLIAALFFFSSVPVVASENYLNVVHTIENVPREDSFWRSTPSSGVIYVGCPLIAKICYQSPYIPMRLVDWNDKPFPRPTLMWMGNGIGLRPALPIVIILMGSSEHPFTKVDLYSDGIFYTTLPGMNSIYLISYSEKGFHHLKLVPEGFESDTLEIDVQIGLNGFFQNILPYLT